MTERRVTETGVDQAARAWLKRTGWSLKNGAEIEATTPTAERIA